MFLTRVEESVRSERVPVNVVDSKFMLQYEQNFQGLFIQFVLHWQLENFNGTIIGSTCESQTIFRLVQLINLYVSNQTTMMFNVEVGIEFLLFGKSNHNQISFFISHNKENGFFLQSHINNFNRGNEFLKEVIYTEDCSQLEVGDNESFILNKGDIQILGVYFLLILTVKGYEFAGQFCVVLHSLFECFVIFV